MIVSIVAPKEGVGSSTLAVILARSRARMGKVLLVDAARDRSLDLYTNTAHLLSSAYSGSIADSRVDCRDLEHLMVLRLEPDDEFLHRIFAEEAGILEDTDVIVDHGSPREGDEALLSKSDQILLVLTQDNQVLRAADRLLGELRNKGLEASFIINMFQDKDPAFLAGQDEIFDLFEEEYMGSVSFHSEIRIAVNTGFTKALPENSQSEGRELAEKIFGPEEAMPSLESLAALEESLEKANNPPSVLEGIQSFFRRFRKG